MLYATNRFPGDGVTTQYEISFTGGYLDRAHVKAYVEGADLVRTPITLTAGNFIGPYTIGGLAPAPVGSTVVIYRDTPKAPIVDFVNGSRFTESNLDTATRQGSFIAAEGADASLGNVSEYADRAEAAAQIATGASTAAVTAKDTVVALLSGAAGLPGSNDSASASALSAAASATQAANSATAAGTAKTAAETARDSAISSATNAGTSASTATTQAGIATAKAEEAALYAALAGQSAGGSGGDLASPAGASLVGFQQAGMGAVSTTVQSKLRESISVKDFGAVGDGVTNDTAAIQAALNYAAANNLSLRFPAGTYIATGLTFTATATGHVCIVGDGSGNTLIQAPPGSTAPVFKLGVGGPSLGPNQLLFQGLSFKGNYPGSYQASAAAYTRHTFLVDTANHILFDDCRFYNGVNGLTVRNGVITHLHRCGAWYNEVGFHVATPGVPNAGTTTLLDKTDAKNNHRWGVYFDDGRMLTMSLCTVEGNGGNGPSSTGGVYVGEYTGAENGPGFNAIGAVIDTTWFEANAGSAQVYLRSGSNTMRDCNFTNVPTSSVILVDGGRYFLDRLRFENNKTYHIYEFAAAKVLAGNSITNCFVGAATNTPANVLSDPAKTSINFGGGGGGAAVTVSGSNVGTGSGLLYRGARDGTGTRTLDFKTLSASTGITVTDSGETVNVAVAPATAGVIGGVRPGAGLLVDGAGVLSIAGSGSGNTTTKVLSGSGNTSAGVLAVFWPAGTWQAAPIVQAQVSTNDSGTATYSVEVFGVTTTGASIRAKRNADGTVTQPVLTVSWIAVGA